jgi:hypothetical protein
VCVWSASHSGRLKPGKEPADTQEVGQASEPVSAPLRRDYTVLPGGTAEEETTIFLNMNLGIPTGQSIQSFSVQTERAFLDLLN